MARSIRVAEFDINRAGYAGASVEVLRAGTTQRASLFSDPLLVVPIPNPVALLSLTGPNGVTYGRFPSNVYVGEPYQLAINGEGATGVERLPIYEVDGTDLSLGVVQSQRPGAIPRTLRALADDVVRALSFGPLVSNQAAPNTAAITAAIAQAAAQGGGAVLLPPGSYEITTLSLPANVRLRGEGLGVTELRSPQAQAVITIAGARAGIEDMTLNGVIQVTNGIGVQAVNQTETVLLNVEIKNFDVALEGVGLQHFLFENLSIQNNLNGAKLLGRLSGGGAALRGGAWRSGIVGGNINTGLLIEAADAEAFGVMIEEVLFTDNTGTALHLKGSRNVIAVGCSWQSNIINLRIEDGSPLSVATNATRSVRILSARVSGGEIRLSGQAKNVVFDTGDFVGVNWNLLSPESRILLRDCNTAGNLVTGLVDRLMRSVGSRVGRFTALTSDATATAIWTMEIPPGDAARIRASVVGRQMNGTNIAVYEIVGAANRAGGSLDFTAASSTVVAGSTVTGLTSGASAVVVAVSQVGMAGTLTLRDVVGTFQAGEGLTFSGGVTASVASPMTVGNAAIVGTPTLIAGGHETDAAWNLTMDASGANARVLVTGAAGQTIEWVAQVEYLLGGGG